MNFVCSLFIFTSTILANSFNVAIEDKPDLIENVYIDTLIQRYIAVESALWKEIRSGETRPHELIQKIRNEHNAILSGETLASVVNDKLKSKFEKYLNLTAFGSYVRDDQKMFNFSVVILSNNTSTNDLFEEARKVCSDTFIGYYLTVDSLRTGYRITKL